MYILVILFVLILLILMFFNKRKEFFEDSVSEGSICKIIFADRNQTGEGLILPGRRIDINSEGMILKKEDDPRDYAYITNSNSRLDGTGYSIHICSKITPNSYTDSKLLGMRLNFSIADKYYDIINNLTSNVNIEVSDYFEQCSIKVNELLTLSAGQTKYDIKQTISGMEFLENKSYSKVYLTGRGENPISLIPHGIKLEKFNGVLFFEIYVGEQVPYGEINKTPVFIKIYENGLNNENMVKIEDVIKLSSGTDTREIVNFNQDDVSLGFFAEPSQQSGETIIFIRPLFNEHEHEPSIIIANNQSGFALKYGQLVDKTNFNLDFNCTFPKDSGKVGVGHKTSSPYETSLYNIENIVFDPEVIHNYIYRVDNKNGRISIYIDGKLESRYAFSNYQSGKVLKFNSIVMSNISEVDVTTVSIELFNRLVDRSDINLLSPNLDDNMTIIPTGETDFREGVDDPFKDFKILEMNNVPENWKLTKHGYVINGSANSESVYIDLKSGALPKLKYPFSIQYSYIFLKPNEELDENGKYYFTVGKNYFKISDEILSTFAKEDIQKYFPNVKADRRFYFNKPYTFTITKTNARVVRVRRNRQIIKIGTVSVYVNSNLWMRRENENIWIPPDPTNIFAPILDNGISNKIPYIAIPPLFINNLVVVLRSIKFYKGITLSENDLSTVSVENTNKINAIDLEEIREKNSSLIRKSEELKEENKIIEADLKKELKQHDDTKQNLEEMTYDYMTYLKKEFNRIVKKEQENKVDVSKKSKLIEFYKKVNKWLIIIFIILIVFGILGFVVKGGNFKEFILSRMGFSRYKYTSAFDYVSNS